MKNTFGNSVEVTLFGESHGPAVGAVLDGMAPGVPVDMGFIAHRLAMRKAKGNISTSRVEEDDFKILSGVFNGRTTGTPICIVIGNKNTKSADYENAYGLARPGHADYTAFVKYNGFEDYRGGGHFSGRVTAGLVAVGAIAASALKRKGIAIGTHIARCGGVSDRPFGDLSIDLAELETKEFAVLDTAREKEMRAVILEAAKDGDSVGGILETVVTGLPAGVGEPWFDTLEGVLSHVLFSIPAVKGVEFGDGFDSVDLRGSEFNDPFRIENNAIKSKTNRNGGINGGISNGMPLLFRCMIKPTPSVFKEQETVDFLKKENASIRVSGRHDPAVIHRARVVADSVTAVSLCDMLALKYGTDWLA